MILICLTLINETQINGAKLDKVCIFLFAKFIPLLKLCVSFFMKSKTFFLFFPLMTMTVRFDILLLVNHYGQPFACQPFEVRQKKNSTKNQTKDPFNFVIGTVNFVSFI